MGHFMSARVGALEKSDLLKKQYFAMALGLVAIALRCVVITFP